MKKMEANLTIDLGKLVDGIKTYPSWTTGRQYPLCIQAIDNEHIEIFYQIAGPVKRKISRQFPRELKLRSRFIWALGFLKGEGSNALGKSNYRRFTITNTNPEFLRIVLDELESMHLFQRENLSNTGVNVLHAKEAESTVRAFWSRELCIPVEKIRYYGDKVKTSKNGVCHIYISDVLLRRVVDEVSSYVMKERGADTRPQ
ncbi:hypothetical protein HYU17_05620 [Candidatus Woesearchaeota archaeon]|nr:hypothetical protein [Candidatus Woesearchaeota archaeon]